MKLIRAQCIHRFSLSFLFRLLFFVGLLCVWAFLNCHFRLRGTRTSENCESINLFHSYWVSFFVNDQWRIWILFPFSLCSQCLHVWPFGIHDDSMQTQTIYIPKILHLLGAWRSCFIFIFIFFYNYLCALWPLYFVDVPWRRWPMLDNHCRELKWEEKNNHSISFSMVQHQQHWPCCRTEKINDAFYTAHFFLPFRLLPLSRSPFCSGCSVCSIACAGLCDLNF